MQKSLLEILRCPLTKTKLRAEVLSTGTKVFGSDIKDVITEAILFSESGLIFPVIDGIPRMLPEAVYDYESFFKKHLPDYDTVLKKAKEQHSEVLAYCIHKNQQTKKSFYFEWSFLKSSQKDKIWHEDISQLTERFLLETGCTADELKNKNVIDVGSGHGIMTGKIAELSGFAVGIELSRAVEEAYKQNQNSNAHYVQADLQFIPFENNSFDLLYSSGVLHHTNNTKNSLEIAEKLVTENGLLCIWLYHPQQNIIHSCMLALRKITSRLPLPVTFVFLSIFLFPVSFLIKRIKRKQKPNYREEMIDLLDMFTPRYRFEIEHETAKHWLEVFFYGNIKITTTDQFGFSITGIKNATGKMPGK